MYVSRSWLHVPRDENCFTLKEESSNKWGWLAQQAYKVKMKCHILTAVSIQKARLHMAPCPRYQSKHRLWVCQGTDSPKHINATATKNNLVWIACHLQPTIRITTRTLLPWGKSIHVGIYYTTANLPQGYGKHPPREKMNQKHELGN